MKRNIYKKLTAFTLCGVFAVVSLTGCGAKAQTELELNNAEDVLSTVYQDAGATMDISDEGVPMDGAPAAISTALMPVASGTVTQGNAKVTIDASNTKEGYIMVDYLEQTSKKLKLIIKGPSGVAYTYDINKIGSYETFPLSDGNGKYSVTVYQNTSGTSYSVVFSTSLDVTLRDQFAPFLLPNQYVNYTADSKTVAKAKELTAGKATDLEKISSVYEWVVSNISYDKQLAATVQSGYLPVLDNVLASKKGICFDYASLMTAMLRSQGIPCKLVIGYSGSAYHAWINAYTNEGGWVNSVIYFDGTNWKLMDPTFASTGRESQAVMKYIGDGANYSAKYLY